MFCFCLLNNRKRYNVSSWSNFVDRNNQPSSTSCCQATSSVRFADDEFQHGNALWRNDGKLRYIRCRHTCLDIEMIMCSMADYDDALRRKLMAIARDGIAGEPCVRARFFLLLIYIDRSAHHVWRERSIRDMFRKKSHGSIDCVRLRKNIFSLYLTFLTET